MPAINTFLLLCAHSQRNANPRHRVLAPCLLSSKLCRCTYA